MGIKPKCGFKLHDLNENKTLESWILTLPFSLLTQTALVSSPCSLKKKILL